MFEGAARPKNFHQLLASSVYALARSIALGNPSFRGLNF
jgi:hypothetical protein